MEMKHDWQYLKKFSWWILGCALLTGVAAYVIAAYRPPMYQAVLTYEVQLVNRPTTPDYQYGSYYDLKGAELFVQHLMSLLRSASIIGEIYREAQLSYTVDNVAQFTNQFRADQGSSQEFTVTFSRYHQAEAEALAKAMTVVLTNHTKMAQTDSTGQSLFQLQGNEPVVVYQKTNPWLAGGVGFVAGGLVVMVLVYLKRYLAS